MEFGVVLPQFGRFASSDSLRRMARAAEDLGWHSVRFADHVVIPHAYAARFSPTFYELFSTMGYVAAATSRV
ncbi:MAG: LLM class flavin-dependent oxidoreductase, partial [Anaerolineae bacterium]